MKSTSYNSNHHQQQPAAAFSSTQPIPQTHTNNNAHGKDSSNAINNNNTAGVGNSQQNMSLTIGHYTLGKSLGKGTFGKVKLAVHTLTGEKVAVKILEKDKIKDKKDVERITREIKILKKVRHPNVIQLYEIIETETELYLIMEFCTGGELFDYIVAHQRLSEKVACKFYQELISGLEYIHQSGVCHRDLKPENLLLDYDKTLKLVDFGLSNMYEPTNDETLKTACGSPCYAAPEMIAGKRYRGLKSDIWSSGVVLFAMVCGYLPFEDPKTSNLYKKILAADYQMPKFVSQEFQDFLKNILNTNPDQRFGFEEIRDHAWYRQIKEKRLCGLFPTKEKMPYNDQMFQTMQDQHHFDNEYSIRCLEANRHNHITATYHLLHKKYLKLNKSVSDYPQMGQAGSIDRGASSQYSKAQRVQRQEQLDDYIKKRGNSINPQVRQDLNQTLPANMYPKALQSVNGGDERANLNDNNDLTAQKKYKIQLQAEINKLQLKYLNNKQQDQKAPSPPQQLKTIEDPLILPTSQVTETPKNQSMMQVNKHASSGVSPTSDTNTYATTTIQKQPSSQSRASSSNNNQSYHHNSMLQPSTKMPSAAATESTNNSSSQNHNPIEYQPIHKRMQTLQQQQQQVQPLQQIIQQTLQQQQQQRFKQSQPVGINTYAQKTQHSNKYSAAQSAEKPKNSFNVTAMKFNSADMTQTKASSSVNKTINGTQNYSTLDPIDLTSNNPKKNSLFNQTMTQFNQIIPDRGTNKSTAANKQRGNSSSLGDPLRQQDTKFNTIIQSLNMSQVVSKNSHLQPMNTTQDYSYPISFNGNNTTKTGNKTSTTNNTSKLNELRLQTPIDIVNFRTYTNTNMNKNAASSINNNTGMDFFIKNGQKIPTTSQVQQPNSYSIRTQQRYNAGGGSVLVSSTGSRQNQGAYSPVQNKDSLNASANLNIQELYKQYQKKQTTLNNTTQFYTTSQKPPTTSNNHYRAISVNDSSKLNSTTIQYSSGTTNRQTPQIMRGKKQYMYNRCVQKTCKWQEHFLNDDRL